MTESLDKIKYIESVSDFDRAAYDWVKIYDLANMPEPTNPEPFEWIDDVARSLNKWKYRKYQEELSNYCDRLCSYADRVLEKLIIDEHYEVIDRIYANVVGRLAYVCKETVRETNYFKP
jgi:hypothetical protein